MDGPNETGVSDRVPAGLESTDPTALPALSRYRVGKMYRDQQGIEEVLERAHNRADRISRQVTGSSVLVVGSSEGLLAILLGREGFHVTGIDADSEAITRAKQLLQNEGSLVKERVKFLNTDITTSDAPKGHYDSVVIGEVIARVTDRQALIQKCVEHVKPGGTCVLTAPFGVSPSPARGQTLVLSDVVASFLPHMAIRDVSTADGYIQLVGRARECPSEGAGATKSAARAGASPTDPYALTPLLIETERATVESQCWLQRNIDELQEEKADMADALREVEASLTKQLKARNRELEQARERADDRAQAANRLLARNASLVKQLESRRAEFDEARQRAVDQAKAISTQKAGVATELEAARRESAEWGRLLYAVLARAARSRREGVALVLDPAGERLALGSEPHWVTAPICGSTNYTLRGVLHANPGQHARTALARFLFLDDQLAAIAPPYPGLSTSERVGSYAYLNSERAAGAFATRFDSPPDACYVSFGLQTWSILPPDSTYIDAILRLSPNAGIGADTCVLLSSASLQLPPTEPADVACDEMLELAREGVFATTTVEGEQDYEISGTLLCSKAELPTAALIQFEFQDRNGKVIAPPLKGFAHSEHAEIDAFMYIAKAGDDARFRMTFRTPAGAASVRLGFRAWNNKAPVFMYRRVTLMPKPAPARTTPPQTDAGTHAATAKDMLTPAPQTFPGQEDQPLVAAILDTMSSSTFGLDCRLLTFAPHDWRYVLEQQPPEFLLVESAWQGNGGSWQYLVGEYAATDRSALKSLIAWCRKQQVPTVFWNKEDPVHFARFKNAAKLFDFVLTTDANTVESYRSLPNSAIQDVAPLMFSAQPRIHHPISRSTRLGAPCFAGSYYANRHLNRRRQMESLLDAAAPFGLVIYDRNHASDSEEFAFPDRFKPHIKGSLSYEDVVEVYKRHKVFLNVNSVADSPTMFSRRVFELLACGTAVLSTPSVGVSRVFGDIVQTAETPDEFRDVMGRLIEDDAYRRSVTRRGLRAVMSQHTTRHRLREVAQVLGLDAFDVRVPTFAVVARVATGADVERLAEMLARQTRQPQAMFVGLAGSLDRDDVVTRLGRQLPDSMVVDVLPVASEDSALMGLAERLDQAALAWVAPVDPANEYDEWFFEDLLICPTFATAEIVGKAAYGYRNADGALCWRAGAEHAYEPAIHPQACLIATDLVRRYGWSVALRAAQARIATMQGQGVRIYASDRDGFIANAKNLT
ncbi:MAG: glycosyltransferase [Phycisphaerae bacterium]|nr:glycosyltransferase [Phycisphaerae bacterium]